MVGGRRGWHYNLSPTIICFNAIPDLQLYDDCVNMNRCLTKLAKFYPTVSLCVCMCVCVCVVWVSECVSLVTTTCTIGYMY